MQSQIFTYVLLAGLAIALLWVIVTDLKSRTISNHLTLTVAAGAPLYWLAIGLPLWPGIAWQLGLATLVFAVCCALFAMRQMGGGDVKLLGALALWFPWQALMTLIMLMALLGGAVTLVTMIHHRIAKKQGQPEIPYGVAISIAALCMIGERYLNHFA